jgi:hypothetical protein
MIYEQRIYHCLPGKLPALLKRFETVTLPLWEAHGIRQAGFWTYEIGPSNQALLYLLAWESLADREARWGKFMVDPDWLKERAASEAGGPIVERIENAFLKPTAFSAVK